MERNSRRANPQWQTQLFLWSSVRVSCVSCHASGPQPTAAKRHRQLTRETELRTERKELEGLLGSVVKRVQVLPAC